MDNNLSFGVVFSVIFGVFMAFVGLWGASGGEKSPLGAFAISLFSFVVAYRCYKQAKEE